MANMPVSVILQAKVDGFVSGMKVARKSVDDLTKAASPKKADAFSSLADKAAVAGVGIAAGLGVAVKRFADFDQAMSAVKANSGSTGAELESLRAAAVKLGADSQFSATEAAQGINELSKAGVKAGDILGGGLKGSLDLAAAGQISVADAAETAATAMTQFGLSGDKVPHIADLLANAANKAQGGVGDMAQALKQAGLVAASTGLSLEETTAGLTAFASAGLLGSDAGTAFKTMLQRLSNPTKEAKAAMDEIGLSAYDSQGNFVGLANVAGQLKDGLSKLTPEQRNAAQATIFGSDAVRASNILYQQGAEGINKWTTAVSEQGAAAKQAATLTDNLKGDVERLGGALDSVFIQTGSSAGGGLRTLVQGAEGLVEQIGKIPGPVLAATASLGALALLAPKGALQYRQYKADLNALGISMDKVSTKAPKTAKALGTIGNVAKGIAIAATAVAVLGKNLDGLAPEQLQQKLTSAADSTKALDQAINGLNKAGFGEGATNVRSFGDVLRYTFDPGFLDSAAHSAEGVLGIFGVEQTNDISVAADRLKEVDTTLANLVSSGNADGAASLFEGLTKQAAAQGVSVDQLKAKFPAYAEAIAGVANAATGAVAPTEALTTTTEDNAEAADKAKQAQIDLAQAVVDAANAMLAASNSDIALAQANTELAKTAATLNGATNKTKTAFDLSKKSGQDAQAALNSYAGTARQAAEDNLKAGDSTKKVDAAMQVARKTFVENAQRLGISASAANRMANEYGLSTQGVKNLKGSLDKLPSSKGVNVNVKTTGLSELARAGEYLRNVNSKRVTLTVGTVRVGNTKVNAGQFATGGAAIGPGTGTSDSIDAKLSNGEHVWTAEEVKKAGGQGAMYRARSLVKAGALRFAKGGAVGFAGGGEVDFSSIFSLLGDVTTLDDVLKARSSSVSKAGSVKSAKNALASLLATQRKIARDLAAARKATKSGTSNQRSAAARRVNDLLDAQKVKLGQVAAAEGKLTAARLASSNAAKATAKVEAEYRADRAPIIDRVTKAAKLSNAGTKTFLDNIEKLNRMGFRTLALNLLDQGSPEAAQIAAQAVKSASKAKALQSSFNTSASLSSRSASLQSLLSGGGRMFSQNLIDPTWRGPGHQTNSYTYDIKAYGNDAEAATRRAMQTLDYQMAVRL